MCRANSFLGRDGELVGKISLVNTPLLFHRHAKTQQNCHVEGTSALVEYRVGGSLPEPSRILSHSLNIEMGRLILAECLDSLIHHNSTSAPIDRATFPDSPFKQPARLSRLSEASS